MTRVTRVTKVTWKTRVTWAARVTWVTEAGCKESQIDSLPFGQAVATMY